MIVEPGLRLWGSERALAATLHALTAVWERIVLVTPPGAELAEEVRANPDRYGQIEIKYLPIGLLHQQGKVARLRALAALLMLAIRLRPGRIYLNQAGLVRLLWPICRALGVPMVVHVRLHEDIARVTLLRGTPRAPLDLIFISDAMVVAAGKNVLPAGTTWHMAYDPYLRRAISAVSDRKAAFVSVGRLSHGKGIHLLVEALARPELTQLDADVYGAGVEGDDYADRLTMQAQALEGRVRMMGFCYDVTTRLPAYQFLVSTSRYETLGRVVMEGWEAGLVPIVYACSGGAAEMVTKAKGGLLFGEWSADALAPVLDRAITMNEDEHQMFVTAGRAWMDRELGFDGYRAALAEILF